MHKRTTPEDMQDLPMSDASMTGATNGAATSMAAMERGFEKVNEDTGFDPMRHGDVRAGQPGVLGRSNGWER